MTRMSGEQRVVGPSPTPAGFTVMALIAAFNEADIIGQVIRDLIDQGVRVYLLDHASTDGTVAEAQPYLGRGLVRIERFTELETGGNGHVSWTSILRRKEALARELEASWFIHHDADEKLAHELDRRAGEADELRQAQDASRRDRRAAGQLDARNRMLAELSHQAEQRNREVEELRRQMDQRIGEADELRPELDTVRRESERLASELTAAQQRLSDLHASLSWRCTAP